MLCSDHRFSCPEGYTCDLVNSTCSLPGVVATPEYVKQHPLLLNVHSSRPERKGRPLSTDVCAIVDGINLPSECQCTPETNAGLVECSVDVLDQIELGSHLSLFFLFLYSEFIIFWIAGVSIDLEPCSNPMQLQLKVTALGATVLSYTIRAGYPPLKFLVHP